MAASCDHRLSCKPEIPASDNDPLFCRISETFQFHNMSSTLHLRRRGCGFEVRDTNARRQVRNHSGQFSTSMSTISTSSSRSFSLFLVLSPIRPSCLVYASTPESQCYGLVARNEGNRSHGNIDAFLAKSWAPRASSIPALSVNKEVHYGDSKAGEDCVVGSRGVVVAYPPTVTQSSLKTVVELASAACTIVFDIRTTVYRHIRRPGVRSHCARSQYLARGAWSFDRASLFNEGAIQDISKLVMHLCYAFLRDHAPLLPSPSALEKAIRYDAITNRTIHIGVVRDVAQIVFTQ